MYDQYMSQSFPRKQIEKVGDIYLYVVEKGDSIYQIAKLFNTKIELIASLNNLAVNDLIHPGEEILIPVLGPNYKATRSAEVAVQPNVMYQPQVYSTPVNEQSQVYSVQLGDQVETYSQPMMQMNQPTDMNMVRSQPITDPYYDSYF